MRILLLGDAHVYGYGLPRRQLSYVGHFVRQIHRADRAVSVDAYAHQILPQVLETLFQLPLSRYDLIIIQPSLDWFISSGCLGTDQSDAIRPNLVHTKFAQRIKTVIHRLRATSRWAFRNRQNASVDVSGLLDTLRPYRHNVLILTPFPHRNPVRQSLRAEVRAALLREGNAQLFSVFDTDWVLRPADEYFLTADAEHLSAVSHELVGRALFDFYQSAPTIVTIQAIRRR